MEQLQSPKIRWLWQQKQQREPDRYAESQQDARASSAQALKMNLKCTATNDSKKCRLTVYVVVAGEKCKKTLTASNRTE